MHGKQTRMKELEASAYSMAHFFEGVWGVNW